MCLSSSMPVCCLATMAFLLAMLWGATGQFSTEWTRRVAECSAAAAVRETRVSAKPFRHQGIQFSAGFIWFQISGQCFSQCASEPPGRNYHGEPRARAERSEMQQNSLWQWPSWVRMLDLPIPSCMTVNILLNLSMTVSSSLRGGDDDKSEIYVCNYCRKRASERVWQKISS